MRNLREMMVEDAFEAPGQDPPLAGVRHLLLLLGVGVVSTLWVHVVVPLFPVGALFCVMKSRALGPVRWVAILLGVGLGATGNGLWVGARDDGVGMGATLALFSATNDDELAVP